MDRYTVFLAFLALHCLTFLPGKAAAYELPDSCYAATEAEFSGCLVDLKKGLFSNIKLDAAFTCESCEFNLTGFHPSRTATIYGNGSRPEHGGSGITRTAHCSATGNATRGALLKLAQVSNVDIKDLWLKNDGQGHCANAGLLHIVFSQDVLVQRIWATTPMFAGIGIIGSSNIEIDRSGVVSSRRFGIWTPSNAQVASDQVSITRNYIAHAAQAGMTLSGSGFQVSENTLSRNHSNIGLENEPQGGQIVIHPNVSNLTLVKNTITNGLIGSPGGKRAHGIEMGGFAIDNVLIENNRIADNEGFAVAFQPSYDISNIVIRNNQFSNNFLSYCTWGNRYYTDIAYVCEEMEPAIYSNFRSGVRVN